MNACRLSVHRCFYDRRMILEWWKLGSPAGVGPAASGNWWGLPESSAWTPTACYHEAGDAKLRLHNVKTSLGVPLLSHSLCCRALLV